MKFTIEKNIFFLIIVYFPFSIIYSTDTDPGDFVIVNGTTTYETLPFIETFSAGSGTSFDKWVSAQWGSFGSVSDDYDCVDGSSCGNDDQYYSSLTPPDSFFLTCNPSDNTYPYCSDVDVWKKHSSAPNWTSAPVARFKYSHTRDYSTSMYSPLINISEFSDMKISFDMYFDAWESTSTNEYLEVEYCTGSGWENALTFLADASLGAVDIPWGTNSFFLTGLRDLDTLQIRFRTHGTFSYNINYWYLDNVNIYGAPVFNTVNITGPVDNPTGAVNNDDVTLSMTSNTDLIALPTVIMNGEVVTSTGSGTDYSATKTISANDAEGPVLYSIDFISLDNIPGQTVTQTTNSSKVIVDRIGPRAYNTGHIFPRGGEPWTRDQVWNSINTNLEVYSTLPPDTAISNFSVLNGWSRFYNDNSTSVTSHGTNGMQLNTLTLEVWAKVQSADTYDGMISYGQAVAGDESGYGFVYFNGMWRFFLVTVSSPQDQWESNPATSIQTGVWTHLAGTYDGSEIKIYKDGVLVNTANRTGNVDYDHVSGSEFYIGGFENDANVNYFNGQVCDVRLWNYARSQSEIAGFRSWTLNGNETGLVSYWKMGEGTGTVLNDATGNSNGTCDATGWVNNAPATLINPVLLDPIYDPNALLGANVKMRISINDGAYTDFGENHTITTNDLVDSMSIITSADFLENVPGFVEGARLKITTKLTDNAGNETIGTRSVDTLLVKQVLNNATPISISSNYSDPTYAKIGNAVTVSFTTAETVLTPTATIQTNSATVTNISGNEYTAAYTFAGGETNGPVVFSIPYHDTFGNPDTLINVTNSSTVIYDDVIPSLFVTIYSNNNNNSYAKLGDSVFVKLESDEKLRDATVNGSILNKQPSIISSNDDSTFIGGIEIKSGDQEGTISFSFNYADFAGNSATRTTTDNSSSVICDTTNPSAFTTGLVVPTGGTVARRFWNSTNTGLSIAIPIDNDPTLIEGIAHPYVIFNAPPSRQLYPPAYNIEANHSGTDYTITFPDSVYEGLTGFAENASVEIYSIISDAPGNSTTGDISSSILKIDQAPPTLIGKTIFSTNNDPTRAILGDTVYLRFTGELEGIDTVSGTIGAQSFDGYEHINGFSSRVFRRMTGAETEGVLPFVLAAGDTARNISSNYTSVDDGSSVDFSAAGPEILLSNIKSNSTYGDSLAKPGDSIIVELRTDMPINLTSSEINSRMASDESPANNRYLYHIIAEDDDQDGIVPFVIDYTDLNGNDYGDIMTTTDTSYVRFDGTDPVFPMVSISSNAADSSIAGANDTIILTFRIHEPVSNSSVTILNNPVNSISALNNNYFRAKYGLTGAESEGIVPFTINAVDLVGNSSSIDSTSNNSYVLFDQTPPANFTVGQVISSGGTVVNGFWNSTNQKILVIVPIDNDISLVDGAVQVLVSFDGSDTLEIGDQNIITESNVNDTIAISRIEFINSENYAEGALALFTARINDFAGYTKIGTPSANQIKVDQTGPILDSIAIESDNLYSNQGAKYTDDVSVTFRPLEDIMTPFILIAGDTADNVTQIGDNWIATRTMQVTDVEGVITFSFTPKDLAGNPGSPSTQTTDGSRVILDNSAPFINYLYEGSIIEDKDYTPSTDSLRLGMDGGDLLSGILRFGFALGDFPGVGNVIPWAETNGIADTLLEGLTLQPNFQYFASAYSVDWAGNISDTIFGDGIIVDNTIPAPGSINTSYDGFVSNDSIDWTIDSTTLNVRWKEFDDNFVIGNYEISILDESDTLKVVDWFSVDTLSDSTTITNLSLKKHMQYFVAIRAVDMAGNKSDSVRTDGIYFDNSPAKIDTIAPSKNNYLDVSSVETIDFKFNKDLTGFKFSLSNIGVDTIPYTINHSDSTVTVSLGEQLLTADTLYFKFDSVASYNRLFMSETITMYSMLWGDLDSNKILDVLDVVRFNSLWPNIDLAPVNFDPPHYDPDLDGEANLRDLAVFSRMWNWYYKTYMPANLLEPGNQIFLDATYRDGQLQIDLPLHTSAGQIIFTDLDNQVMKLSEASSVFNNLVFVNEDSLARIKAYTFASLGENIDSVFSINLKLNSKKDYHQNMQVRFYDNDGKEILHGSTILKITPIPNQYALGQNYPNPFNPSTTIQFELPEESYTQIAIYDLLGRELIQLVNEICTAGYHEVIWNGKDSFGRTIPSGMYLYRMDTNGFSSTRKLVFLK
jgi:hypothetical protein